MDNMSDLIVFLNKIFKLYKLNSKRFYERNQFRKSMFYKNNINFSNEIITVTSDLDSKKHLIYVHGGAFVLGMSKRQDKFIKKVQDSCCCYLSLIDYPLAYQNNIIDSLDYLEKCFFEISNKYSDHEFIFIGDSAGCALILLLFDRLKNKISSRFKVILISPFLDFDLDNKDIKKFQKLDPVLDASVLKKIVSRYVSSGVKSPIDIEFSNMDFLIITGNREIFYPDCCLFYERLIKNDCKVRLIEADKMFHDYVLVAGSSTNQAVSIIKEYIAN